MSDQLRWARFHLGDGRAESGVRVLPAEVLHRMKEPTVALRASTLGDEIGICGFLRGVDGVRTVGQSGRNRGRGGGSFDDPRHGGVPLGLFRLADEDDLPPLDYIGPLGERWDVVDIWIRQ